MARRLAPLIFLAMIVGFAVGCALHSLISDPTAIATIAGALSILGAIAPRMIKMIGASPMPAPRPWSA